MKKAVLLLCLLPWAASAERVAELFSDKGNTFVRAGSQSGIVVGSQLTLTTDQPGAHRVGSANVLEVWESMARLSVDEAAAKAKPRYAILSPVKAAEPAKDPVAPKPQPTSPLPSNLRGRAEGNLTRLKIINDTNMTWTHCELRLPDNRTYMLDELPAVSDEGVMWLKFKSPPRPPMDGITATCDEGETKFLYANPRGEGALKGHVEHGHMGRIIVYNDSDVSWNRCVLKQPDGSQYVMGTLKSHSDEGLVPSRFKNENEIPINYVDVRCSQGEGRFKW